MRRICLLLMLAVMPLAGGCVAAVLNGAASGDAASKNRPDLLDDARITREVRMQLYRDALLGDERIHVSTERGIVTLTGTVDNRMHASRAMELANSVAGVRGVHLELKVTDTP